MHEHIDTHVFIHNHYNFKLTPRSRKYCGYVEPMLSQEDIFAVHWCKFVVKCSFSQLSYLFAGTPDLSDQSSSDSRGLKEFYASIKVDAPIKVPSSSKKHVSFLNLLCKTH